MKIEPCLIDPCRAPLACSAFGYCRHRNFIDGRLADRLAATVDQKPCDVGLFSDERDQLDLVDMARAKR